MLCDLLLPISSRWCVPYEEIAVQVITGHFSATISCVLITALHNLLQVHKHSQKYNYQHSNNKLHLLPAYFEAYVMLICS